jgi:hypothetical protein
MKLLVVLLVLPTVTQLQRSSLAQDDATSIAGYASLACGDAETIPGTTNCCLAASIRFRTFKHNFHDLFCLRRVRSKCRFKGNFHNDFTDACNCPIPLNTSGIITAKHEAEPPVIFLSTATARGPPRSGDQSLYLFDHALDRPARLFYIAPLHSVPISPFFVTAQHDSPVHPLIPGELNGSFVCCSHFPSNITKPFTSRSYYEIQM